MSVFDVYGQWRSQGQQAIERLHTKTVVLLHGNSPQERAKIEEIRAAWKRETGDQSVRVVTQPADVSF